MNLTWKPEEKVQGTLGRGFYFVLSGQSEEVECSEVEIHEEEPHVKETHKEEIHEEKPHGTDQSATLKPTKQQQALRKLMDFLRLHYAFRYNRLTDRTECADLQADHLRYQPVDSRVLNSISLQAMQVGIPCWDRDVKRYVESSDCLLYTSDAADEL